MNTWQSIVGVLISLLGMWMAVVAFGAEARAPLITIRKCPQPPDLQAGPDAIAFRDATLLTGWTDISSGGLASGRTEAAFAFDESCLYIAFKCFSPSPPKAAIKVRDGQVWEDDAVEVFLDPTYSRSEYYQFIGNAAGAVWDSKGRDGAWNGQWDYAAKVGQGFWTATFKIPFSTLGVKAPADGTVWGLNLGRDQQTPVREISSWVPLEGSFHSPDKFGRLRFERQGAAVRLLSVGLGTLQAEVVAGKIPVEFSASVGVLPPAPKAAARTLQTLRIEPGDRKRIDVAPKMPVPGEYAITWQLKDLMMASIVSEAALYFKVLEPLVISLRKYFLNGILGVDVSAAGLGAVPGLSARVEIRKASETAPILEATIAEFDHQRKGSIEMSTAKLPPGEYHVIVRALDRSDKELARASTAFTLPPKPGWLRSTSGITDTVLPPWTPLRVEGRRVECWGRRYDFKDSFLPAEVIALGESLLAAPIELRAMVRGKTLNWWGGSLKTVLKTDARVDYEFHASADDIELTGKSFVEYDGMIWVDLEISPKHPVTLDSLTIEMPMKESAATLMHYFPGQWGKATNSGAIPEAGWSFQFRPFVWLGTEECGLAWFMETDELFVLKDKAKALEIIRERGEAAPKPDVLGALLGKKSENAVRLRVHLIDGPFEVKEPRRYAFGFQASPVKPWPNDFHEWRICHGAFYGMDKKPASRSTSVTYPAEGNIQIAEGTVEAWITPTFDPNVKIENPSARGMFNQSFFAVRFRNAEAGFYWNIDDRGMRYYAKVDDRFPIILPSHSEWKQGEAHHVALTWGKELAIYVDGKRLASKPFEGLLGGASPKASEAMISLGPGEFIVDELRISDIARTQFDLNKPPAADEHTLLLDHFDDPSPNRFGAQTKPTKIAGAMGGLVSRGGAWATTRFGKGLVLGSKVEGGHSALDVAQQLGVKTLIYHENWTDIQNYRMVGHEQELKHLVAECHKRGIRLLVYFGYEISNIAPEYEIYGRDVGRFNPDGPLPMKGGYHRSPEQHAFGVCYNSWWQNFLCDAIERTMKEYDLDGVYLDGTIEPMGCANYRHGCGYKRPDGGYAPTYPILAVRETMKRIYAICTAKPGGQVNAHQSTCCTTPTLAFTTSYWDGEQLGGVPHADNPLEVLPLDTFRAEFMGRNFGVPCELLNYAPKPYTLDEALSFSMLHDVLVRPGGVGPALEQMSEIWQVFSDFGVDGAEFLPYWRNADVVQTSSPAILASIYRRPEKGLLMVISNLGRSDDPAASAQLDLAKLDMAGRTLHAEDALLRQPVPIQDGKITLPLNRMRMRLVWVK